MLKKLLAVLLALCATFAMAAVDVNKASEADLDAVKGIGPVTSKLIMAERKKGEFKSWQDFIDRVKGVGDGRAAKLSEEGLTVNGAPFKAASTTKAEAKDAKKDAKAAVKDEKKDVKTAVKEEKKGAKAVAKDAKNDVKAAEAKPAASAKK